MCVLKAFMILAVAKFCLVSVSNTDAATFTTSKAHLPAHDDRCFEKVTQPAMVSNNEYKPKGICTLIPCDANTLDMDIESCPYIQMTNCEELSPNPPPSPTNCCPKFKCVDLKTGKEYIVSA